MVNTFTAGMTRFAFGLALAAGAAAQAAEPVGDGASGEAVQLEISAGSLYGTLLSPKADAGGRKPAVVLIVAGSGPTDRNGNQPPALHCDAYRLLAESLRDAGVATLRYDKRGIGESVKVEERGLRFEDYADDAASWVAWLKREGRFSRVVVLGHSEGSLLGMLACRRAAGADAFISVAGPGRPADELIRQQVEGQPEGVKAALFPILDALKAGKEAADVPPILAPLARPSVQPYMISWMKYDPREEIGKLDMPALILHGAADIQAPPEDADLLAAARPGARKAVIQGMNHVLKQCATTEIVAQTTTYLSPEAPLAEGLVREIVEFVDRLTYSTLNSKQG